MSNKDWIFGDKEVSRHFRAIPDGVRSRVIDAIGGLSYRLQLKVEREKLKGQVLKVRTGLLHRSINSRLLTDNNAVVGIVSTNVGYGKAHEYGFSGTVTVKEHLRKIRKQGRMSLRSVKGHEMKVWTKKRGALTGGVATVGAHTRHVDLPERSFLRSALADMQKEIVSGVEKAVADGIKRK